MGSSSTVMEKERALGWGEPADVYVVIVAYFCFENLLREGDHFFLRGPLCLFLICAPGSAVTPNHFDGLKKEGGGVINFSMVMVPVDVI